MVMTSGAFKDAISGRQRTTDGIHKHIGPFIIVQGPVTLPPASVGTQELMPSAAQQMIGSYAQPVSWTLPSTNVWTETPIQAQCTFDGVPTRVEYGFLVSCPVKGQRVFWSIMADGVIQSPGSALGALDAPEAGYAAMASGCFYATPSAGTHRIAIGLYGPSGSQLYDVIWSTLYVTEQKR